jgi:high-affinity K+ transport system ATPase subunit B
MKMIIGKNPIVSRFVIVSSALFLVVIAGISLAFLFSMRQLIITDSYKILVTALFIVALIIMLLIFVVFSVFISALLESQCKMMEYIEQARNEAMTANWCQWNLITLMSREICTSMNTVIDIAQSELQHKDLPDECATALKKICSSANTLIGNDEIFAQK